MKAEGILDSFDAAERDWDLGIIDEAHGYTMQSTARVSSIRRATGTRQRRRSREGAPAHPADRHAPLGRDDRVPVGAAPAPRSRRLRGSVPKGIELNAQQFRKVPKERWSTSGREAL